MSLTVNEKNEQTTITCGQDRRITWNSPQFSIYFLNN